MPEGRASSGVRVRRCASSCGCFGAMLRLFRRLVAHTAFRDLKFLKRF